MYLYLMTGPVLRINSDTKKRQREAISFCNKKEFIDYIVQTGENYEIDKTKAEGMMWNKTNVCKGDTQSIHMKVPGVKIYHSLARVKVM